jgi:hypothetical protein
MTKIQSVALRFLKGFIAGGLANIVPILVGTINIHDLTSAKALLSILTTSFLTGGLLAIEKMITWQDVPPSTPQS